MKKYAKNLIFSVLILGLYFAGAGITEAAVPSIESVSAKPTATEVTLNGLINPNGYATTAWFEYGTTSNLLNFNETVHSYVGSTIYSFPYEQVITKLLPETTYYFRIVANNGQSTEKSRIMSFTTEKAQLAETTSTTKDNVVQPDNSRMIQITTITPDNIGLGSEIVYLVVFKNTTSNNLLNTKISVELPKEVSFKETNYGRQEDVNTVVFNAEVLVPDQISSLTIKGTYNQENTIDQNAILATALMSYEALDASGVTKTREQVAYVVSHTLNDSTSNETNPLTANIFSGTGFFPKTLIGWLVILLVVMSLILVGRQLYIKIPAKPKVVKKAS